jgi:hypothetical protein
MIATIANSSPLGWSALCAKNLTVWVSSLHSTDTTRPLLTGIAMTHHETKGVTLYGHLICSAAARGRSDLSLWSFRCRGCCLLTGSFVRSTAVIIICHSSTQRLTGDGSEVEMKMKMKWISCFIMPQSQDFKGGEQQFQLSKHAKIPRRCIPAVTHPKIQKNCTARTRKTESGKVSIIFSS